MEWMQRLNQSIEYIEQHITEELDYEKVEMCIRDRVYVYPIYANDDFGWGLRRDWLARCFSTFATEEISLSYCGFD